MLKKLFIILVFLFTNLITFIYSQAPSEIIEPEISWIKYHQGYEGKVVQQTFDGGYILLASGNFPDNKNIAVIKTDSNGDAVWTRRFGTFSFDLPVFIQQISDSGYIVAIQHMDYDSSEYYPSIIKLDNYGDVIWQEVYDDIRSDIIIENTLIQEVKETIDKGFIVVGTISEDLLIFKLTDTGGISWSKVYAALSESEAYSVEEIQGEGYIIAGRTVIPWYSYDIWLLKTDSEGDTLWTKYFGEDGYDMAFCLRQTNDSGYMIAGAFDWHAWLIKTDNTGNEMWNKVYKENSTGFLYCVQQLEDGGFITVGKVALPDPTYYEGWVIRTDSLGNILWEKYYGGEGADNFNYIQQTKDNGFIIIGNYQTDSYDEIPTLLLLKLHSEISNRIEPENQFIKTYMLYQNYPNPFNPSTKISYSIPQSDFVVLKIYNILGQEIHTFVNKFQKAGDYTVNFNAQNLSSGIYFYKLQVGNKITETKKMILMR